MIERYGLSEAQKGYLNGSKKLSNESKERKAIIHKALQSWSVLKPILDSKVVSNDFKYFSFISKPTSSEFEKYNIPKDQYSFKNFLDSLLATNKENPTSKEIEKMAIAKEIIESAILYYQTRFKNNELVWNKFNEFSDFIKMLQGVYEQELDNIVKSDFVRIRKNMVFPPRIERNQYWHSLCMQCFSYSTKVNATTKEETLEINHSKDCPYLKEFERVEDKQIVIEDFIHFIEPKTE
jgi:hypothetical protein